MSLESWKKEFYKTPARSMMGSPPKDLVEHSLNKWTGLLPQNLAKHGVMVQAGEVGIPEVDEEEEWWPISGTNCALCQEHHDCKGCPLKRTMGHECDRGCGTVCGVLMLTTSNQEDCSYSVHRDVDTKEWLYRTQAPQVSVIAIDGDVWVNMANTKGYGCYVATESVWISGWVDVFRRRHPFEPPPVHLRPGHILEISLLDAEDL